MELKKLLIDRGVLSSPVTECREYTVKIVNYAGCSRDWRGEFVCLAARDFSVVTCRGSKYRERIARQRT